MSSARPWAACWLAGAIMASPAHAQNRSSDNALTQAEDAFGFSVGRETIGIYNSGQTRGFSPTAAGNVRIDGLYVNPVAGFPGELIGSTSIRVGLSAQGYPFLAPSGVFDQSLRRPAAESGGSVIFSGDSWGGHQIEADTTVRLTSTLALRGGGQIGRTVYPNFTDNFFHSESILLDWRPSPAVRITPFYGQFDDYDDEAGTNYIPSGAFIPPVDRPHHDESPNWSDNRFSNKAAGVVAEVQPAKDWQLRMAMLRSINDVKTGFAFFLTDEDREGNGNRLLIANPPSRSTSTSGEVRLTRSLAEGPRLHVVHLSLRGRNVARPFGGSAVVDYGPGRVGERVTDPEPTFDFGPLSLSEIHERDVGIAYDGRWKDVGEFSASLSRTHYRKVTSLPGLEPVEARAAPWLYNATLAVIPAKRVTVYAGIARGFEESGLAPPSAANRNEPLESIITRQRDVGARLDIGGGRKLVAGLFELSRPIFGFDNGNVFRPVGEVRSRGGEFSVAGPIVPGLDLVAGGVVFWPKVSRSSSAVGDVGPRPAQLPTHILTANLNWSRTGVKGLQFDLGVNHRGRQPATVDNLVFMPGRLNVNAGARYGFRLDRHPASLRFQVTNLTNNTFPTLTAPGVYGSRPARQATISLTIDD